METSEFSAVNMAAWRPLELYQNKHFRFRQNTQRNKQIRFDKIRYICYEDRNYTKENTDWGVCIFNKKLHFFNWNIQISWRFIVKGLSYRFL